MGSCWVDPYAATPYVSQALPGWNEEFHDQLLRTGNVVFPRQKWGADFECLNALDQFSLLNPDWRSRIHLPEYPTPEVTREEIKDLVRLKDQRPAVLQEIA